ncbi:hypothetical protein CUMW_109390, partial [Citrus unshiu]
AEVQSSFHLKSFNQKIHKTASSENKTATSHKLLLSLPKKSYDVELIDRIAMAMTSDETTKICMTELYRLQILICILHIARGIWNDVKYVVTWFQGNMLRSTS